MHPFTYHRAASIDDARARLAADADARLLAGGMTLLPTLKHRLASPSALIDISRLASLRAIARDGELLTIGAAVTHRGVADDDTVRATIPALADLASRIGDPQVRARGTLGGSLANNDPAADYPAAVLGLGARVRTDRRVIEADGFFTGMFATALQPDEIVTAVEFPVPRRAAYAKCPHPASGYAMTGVFVAVAADGGVRVAVTGAAAGVFRWREAEVALASSTEPGVLAGLPLDESAMNEDLHASAAYRANLVRVMTVRAVAAIGNPAAGRGVAR